MNAIQHGMPGEWAKVRGTVLSLWPLFLCFVALGAFGAALAMGKYTLVFAALFVLSLVATMVLWRKGLRRVESFFKGARGEERVAALLATLPGGWHVFNDFVAGGHHVDHVVAGPAGVFSVETKSWRGSVTVEEGEILLNGSLPDRAPVTQATREAAAVKAALKRAGWEKGEGRRYAGAVLRLGHVCRCAADGRHGRGGERERSDGVDAVAADGAVGQRR